MTATLFAFVFLACLSTLADAYYLAILSPRPSSRLNFHYQPNSYFVIRAASDLPNELPSGATNPNNEETMETKIVVSVGDFALGSYNLEDLNNGIGWTVPENTFREGTRDYGALTSRRKRTSNQSDVCVFFRLVFRISPFLLCQDITLTGPTVCLDSGCAPVQAQLSIAIAGDLVVVPTTPAIIRTTKPPAITTVPVIPTTPASIPTTIPLIRTTKAVLPTTKPILKTKAALKLTTKRENPKLTNKAKQTTIKPKQTTIKPLSSSIRYSASATKSSPSATLPGYQVPATVRASPLGTATTATIPTSGLASGAVAGIAVAGIVVIAGLAGGLFLLAKKRKREEDDGWPKGEEDKKPFGGSGESTGNGMGEDWMDKVASSTRTSFSVPTQEHRRLDLGPNGFVRVESPGSPQRALTFSRQPKQTPTTPYRTPTSPARLPQINDSPVSKFSRTSHPEEIVLMSPQLLSPTSPTIPAPPLGLSDMGSIEHFAVARVESQGSLVEKLEARLEELKTPITPMVPEFSTPIASVYVDEYPVEGLKRSATESSLASSVTSPIRTPRRLPTPPQIQGQQEHDIEIEIQSQESDEDDEPLSRPFSTNIGQYGSISLPRHPRSPQASQSATPNLPQRARLPSYGTGSLSATWSAREL